MKKNFNSLKQFINDAKKGDKFIYHMGVLSIDRQTNPVLDKLAQDLLEYYQKGFLELAQKKLSENRFQYIAVRTNDVGRRFFSGCYNQ